MNIHRKERTDKKQKFLGSLYLEYSMSESNCKLFEKCTPDEVATLNDYIHTYNLIKRCTGVGTDQLSAFKISLNSDLQEMIYKCSAIAEENGIGFFPKEIMTEALIDKLLKLSNEVDLNNVFNEHSFNPNHKNLSSYVNQDADKKAIIKALLNTDKTEALIDSFNSNLINYGKAKTFTVDFLSSVSNNDSTERIKSFWLSNAVDVLIEHFKDIPPLCNPKMVFEYWLLPRIKLLRPANAFESFKAKVKSPFSKSDFDSVTLDLYTRPIPSNQIFRTEI